MCTLYDIIPGSKLHVFHFDDTFHTVKTMTAKLLVLANQTFSARKCRDLELDIPPSLLAQEEDKEKRQKCIFRSVALVYDIDIFSFIKTNIFKINIDEFIDSFRKVRPIPCVYDC